MNYAQYRAWREQAIGQKPALRLDCMNPAKAMSHMLPTVRNQRATTTSQLADLWSRTTGMRLKPGRFVIGLGVRAILAAVLDILGTSRRFWLPEDVYPVYWQLASERTTSSFETLVDFDLSFLKQCGPNDCVLLPSPLSPLGRPLRPHEVRALTDWLDENPQRVLILDCVYRYSFHLSAALSRLLEHDGCLALYSLSKSWLMPGAFGLATVPASLYPLLQSQLEPPAPASLQQAAGLLCAAPHLACLLDARYSAQWQRLTDHIRQVDRAWMRPDTGYFSTLPVAQQTLWNDFDIAAVPASVFGSHRDDLSVISCLFEITSDSHVLE